MDVGDGCEWRREKQEVRGAGAPAEAPGQRDDETRSKYGGMALPLGPHPRKARTAKPGRGGRRDVIAGFHMINMSLMGSIRQDAIDEVPHPTWNRPARCQGRGAQPPAIAALHRCVPGPTLQQHLLTACGYEREPLYHAHALSFLEKIFIASTHRLRGHRASSHSGTVMGGPNELGCGGRHETRTTVSPGATIFLRELHEQWPKCSLPERMHR